MQCFCVSISLSVRPTFLRQMDMGSLTCAYKFGCVLYTRKGGSGTNKQVCTRVDSEEPKASSGRLHCVLAENRFDSSVAVVSVLDASPVKSVHVLAGLMVSSYCDST